MNLSCSVVVFACWLCDGAVYAPAVPVQSLVDQRVVHANLLTQVRQCNDLTTVPHDAEVAI